MCWNFWDGCCTERFSLSRFFPQGWWDMNTFPGDTCLFEHWCWVVQMKLVAHDRIECEVGHVGWFFSNNLSIHDAWWTFSWVNDRTSRRLFLFLTCHLIGWPSNLATTSTGFAKFQPSTILAVTVSLRFLTGWRAAGGWKDGHAIEFSTCQGRALGCRRCVTTSSKHGFTQSVDIGGTKRTRDSCVTWVGKFKLAKLLTLLFFGH